jgi:hypothetical protein
MAPDPSFDDPPRKERRPMRKLARTLAVCGYQRTQPLDARICAARSLKVEYLN